MPIEFVTRVDLTCDDANRRGSRYFSQEFDQVASGLGEPLNPAELRMNAALSAQMSHTYTVPEWSTGRYFASPWALARENVEVSSSDEEPDDTDRAFAEQYAQDVRSDEDEQQQDRRRKHTGAGELGRASSSMKKSSLKGKSPASSKSKPGSARKSEALDPSKSGKEGAATASKQPERKADEKEKGDHKVAAPSSISSSAAEVKKNSTSTSKKQKQAHGDENVAENKDETGTTTMEKDGNASPAASQHGNKKPSPKAKSKAVDVEKE
ncbi:unnamed protein product, partial [Amoebophrya sp. A25]|eukprot:GSA25T00025197001.1